MRGMGGVERGEEEKAVRNEMSRERRGIERCEEGDEWREKRGEKNARNGRSGERKGGEKCKEWKE